MSKHCPHCGMLLKETNWDRFFCANCGIIEEDRDLSDQESLGSYIG